MIFLKNTTTGTTHHLVFGTHISIDIGFHVIVITT